MVEELLEKLTLDEKVALLGGSDLWHAAGVERLGIPPLKVSDGPHGVRGGDLSGTVTAASFPCGTAMGATWNPDLVKRLGVAVGEEARTKNVHVVLGPTVNLHRTPLAGRNFECYAEDPELSARLAVAFVRGLQSTGVGACVKHFVCNDSEFERHTISSEVDERALRELYLVPFEAAVREADPWSVMTAYNRINGTYACDHPLLADVLRGEWGFGGFVISDWFGLQSTEDALLAGNDLEMPAPSRWRGDKLLDAVREGQADEKDLDVCVRRMLRVRERAGILQATVSDAEEGVDRDEHRAVARQTARESIVLLRNEGDVLPLDPEALRRVAVIGPAANQAGVMGGGSSRLAPHYAVSPLDGITARLGDAVEVSYEPGCSYHKTLPFLEGDFEVAFHAGFECAGEPILVTRAPRVFFNWLGRFSQEIDAENFSVRVTGRFEPSRAGEWTFGVSSAGRSRLLVNGREVVDNWTEQERGESFYGAGSTEKRGTVVLDGPCDVEILYSKEGAPILGGLQAGALEPIGEDAPSRAEVAAAAADAAIVVVGLNGDWESEGKDRASLALPGEQAALVERVIAANPRTVVALNAGSPVAGEWMDGAPALLTLWYGGQEAGNALADVLFGDVCPSGRLPQTWPRRLEDNPAHATYPGQEGRVEYADGVFMGYRGYERNRVAPRFAFGHGLSYTRFEYGAVEAQVSGSDVEIQVPITNAGSRAGQEVVQVYVRDAEARLPRPDKELRAFAKLTLEPGELQVARFSLGTRAFAFWDPEAHDWCVESGAFEVLVGSASDAIHGRVEFALQV